MNRRLLLLWSILIVGVSPISQQEVLAHEIELNAKAEVKDLVWEKLNKKKQQLPTGKRPFIFFHQRKAGGSSVRAMLEKAANQNKLNFWIPCHGGVSCENTEIPLTPPQISIYAGHIEWPSFTKHMARLSNSGATLNPTQQQFECLTIFREPVSRVQSCWNFRFLQEFGKVRGARPFAQYTVDELKALPRAESIQAEGCNNEPMRLFSDLSSADTKINTLTTGPISGDVGTTDYAYDEKGWDLDTNFILNNTVRHMQHCVIGISERCEDTRRVIQFFFPWFTSLSCKVHLNKAQFSADDNLLTPGVISEVKRQNALEIILYNIANLTLDVQLQAIQEIEEAKASQKDKIINNLSKMPRKIWQCWFQGWQDLQQNEKFNAIGVDAWIKLHVPKGWNHTLLTTKNIELYVPEYWMVVKKETYPHVLPNKSDLLRLLVLNKFGGVWIDASLYPTLPLDNWIHDKVQKTGFFAFSFVPKLPGRIAASWFLAAEMKNIIIQNWLDAYRRRFLMPEKFETYFQVHKMLAKLYFENHTFHDIFDAMPSVSAASPHSFLYGEQYKKFDLTQPPAPVLKRPAALNLTWYISVFFSAYNLTRPVFLNETRAVRPKVHHEATRRTR